MKHRLRDVRRAPYWRRAHHHWPFWVGVFLMFAAIGIYVMTDSFALVPYRDIGQRSSHAG